MCFLLCIVIVLLSCVPDFIQFIFIRAVFSAVVSLTVPSGLLFLLIDVFRLFPELSMANKASFILSVCPQCFETDSSPAVLVGIS